MIRVLLFLAFIAAVAFGFVWIADRPGDIAITWQGRQIETSVLVAAVALVAVVAVAIFLWSIIRTILRSPDLIGMFLSHRRGVRGYLAISRGLVAVGSGDVRAAQRASDEASRIAPGEPLALLLDAQCAQLSGDRAAAEHAFRKMAEREDTKLLGLRGLYIEAQRRQDHAAARAYAEEAANASPSLGWAGQAVLEFRSTAGDWTGAQAALDRNSRYNLIDKADYKRQRAVLITARALADRRLGTLSLRERFGTDVARLRRDDVESLATPQTELKVGDRVLIVTTAPRMEAVRDFFGNSTRGLSNLDWISLGTGMALGYLLGMVTIPLPGGASFSLGPAAGCILVGLALGAIGRTGPTVWEPSTEIALTLRQFGLMLFLGVVGLAAGPAFIETVFTRVGGLAILMSAVLTALTAALLIAAARLLGQSVDRTFGALAGITGQPAILDYALSRSTDARVTEGYAQLFALIMVVKIATVPFML